MSCGISCLVTWCCWRIACQSLCNTPKCNYSTCTNIPASVPLILPPKLWQCNGHIGTQVESLLPTIRAPHLRLSEQQSHRPQKNRLSFAVLLLFFFFLSPFPQTTWNEGFFLFWGLAVCLHASNKPVCLCWFLTVNISSVETSVFHFF